MRRTAGRGEGAQETEMSKILNWPWIRFGECERSGLDRGGLCGPGAAVKRF